MFRIRAIALPAAALCLLLSGACSDVSPAGGPGAAECRTHNDCAPGNDCQIPTCNELTGKCELSLRAGFCFVGGACYRTGDTDPADPCQRCDPGAGTDSFVPKVCPSGWACNAQSGVCELAPTDAGGSDDRGTAQDAGDEGTADPGEDTSGVSDEGDGGGEDAPDPGDQGDPGVEDPGPERDLPGDADTGLLDPGGDAADAGDAGPEDAGDEGEDADAGPPEPCTTDEECVARLGLGSCYLVSCEDDLCVAVPQRSGVSCEPRGQEDNPCIAGTCDGDGLCKVEKFSNTPCDDFDPCTLSDVCEEGRCQGVPIVCADGNPCTGDDCHQGACTFVPEPDGTACDDNDPCTSGEKCAKAVCGGGRSTCPCLVDSDCRDDGDLCNGVPECVSQDDGTRACAIDPETIKRCDTSGDDACNQTACEPETGQCVERPRTAEPCDDGDPCTYRDTCAEDGACTGQDLDCNDDDPCTDDVCAAGECVSVPNAAPCNDDDPCTTGDLCVGGKCMGSPNMCDDGNPCTEDTCLDGQCQHDATPNAPCDDGSPCTTGDTCHCPGEGTNCWGVVCLGDPLLCPDAPECTVGICDPEDLPDTYDPADPPSACKHEPIEDTCDDGDKCTVGDICKDGSCAPGEQTLACFVGLTCKKGVCDPLEGCVSMNIEDGTSCDDGDKCTQGTTCTGGVCGGGTLICECQRDEDCDDQNPCTGVERCEEQEGGDKVCRPGTPVSCPALDDFCRVNACNPASGQCEATNENEGKPCKPDDACFRQYVCRGGKCKAEVEVACAAPPCFQVTGCDPVTGCQVSAAGQGAPCKDNNECTQNETCDEHNQCRGENVVCPDDGNPCTIKRCNSSVGCVVENKADGVSCEVDANPCTVGTCESGLCQEAALPCDDGIPCTATDCDTSTGKCLYTPDDSICDDGNPCTEDFCERTAGCTHPSLHDFPACDDEDPSTGPDVCFRGNCIGFEPTTSAVGSCDVKGVSPVGAETWQGAFHVAVGYTGGTYVSGSCSDIGARTDLYRLSGVGHTDPLDRKSAGPPAGFSEAVVVGSSGLIALLSDTGSSVDFTSRLGEAVEDQGGLGYHHRVVHHLSYMDDEEEQRSVLIGSETPGGKGEAFVCAPRGSGRDWACSTATFSVLGSPRSNERRFGAAAQVPVDCGAGSGNCKVQRILVSNSTNNELHVLSSTGSGGFWKVHEEEREGWEITGAVGGPDGGAWIFGSAGRLYRCGGAWRDCAQFNAIRDQGQLHFRGAWAYGEGIVFVATSATTNKLIFLDKDAEPGLPSSYVVHELDGDIDGAPAATALFPVGSTSRGLYVVGTTEDGKSLAIWSAPL